MKKFIVFETYCFGTNYYSADGLCIPDYNLEGDIPTMTEKEAETILERHPFARIQQL